MAPWDVAYQFLESCWWGKFINMVKNIAARLCCPLLCCLIHFHVLVSNWFWSCIAGIFCVCQWSFAEICLLVLLLPISFSATLHNPTHLQFLPPVVEHLILLHSWDVSRIFISSSIFTKILWLFLGTYNINILLQSWDWLVLAANYSNTMINSMHRISSKECNYTSN